MLLGSEGACADVRDYRKYGSVGEHQVRQAIPVHIHDGHLHVLPQRRNVNRCLKRSVAIAIQDLNQVVITEVDNQIEMTVAVDVSGGDDVGQIYGWQLIGRLKCSIPVAEKNLKRIRLILRDHYVQMTILVE